MFNRIKTFEEQERALNPHILQTIADIFIHNQVHHQYGAGILHRHQQRRRGVESIGSLGECWVPFSSKRLTSAIFPSAAAFARPISSSKSTTDVWQIRQRPVSKIDLAKQASWVQCVHSHRSVTTSSPISQPSRQIQHDSAAVLPSTFLRCATVFGVPRCPTTSGSYHDRPDATHQGLP